MYALSNRYNGIFVLRFVSFVKFSVVFGFQTHCHINGISALCAANNRKEGVRNINRKGEREINYENYRRKEQEVVTVVRIKGFYSSHLLFSSLAFSYMSLS